MPQDAVPLGGSGYSHPCTIELTSSVTPEQEATGRRIACLVPGSGMSASYGRLDAKNRVEAFCPSIKLHHRSREPGRQEPAAHGPILRQHSSRPLGGEHRRHRARGKSIKIGSSAAAPRRLSPRGLRLSKKKGWTRLCSIYWRKPFSMFRTSRRMTRSSFRWMNCRARRQGGTETLIGTEAFLATLMRTGKLPGVRTAIFKANN